jgi:hypothetical protein
MTTWVRSRGSHSICFNLDDLGLDPAFWSSATLHRGAFTLSTQRFQDPQAAA